MIKQICFAYILVRTKSVCCFNFIFKSFGNGSRIDEKFKLQLLLPELLFESCLSCLAGAKSVKGTILAPAQVNRRQKNKRQNKNYKNVAKSSQDY